MTRLTMQQLFHVGDDDSGCFLRVSCSKVDVIMIVMAMMVDVVNSDNSDVDDDAVGVEKGVASCDKVTARSCQDGKSC